MKDNNQQIKPVELEEVEIYSQSIQSEKNSHELDESSEDNFYSRMPMRIQNLLDRIKNLNDRSSSDEEYSAIHSEKLNLNFYDLQNLYRYYSVDKFIEWISYNDYLAHLEKCTACTQCKRWCDTCEKYVIN